MLSTGTGFSSKKNSVDLVGSCAFLGEMRVGDGLLIRTVIGHSGSVPSVDIILGPNRGLLFFFFVFVDILRCDIDFGTPLTSSWCSARNICGAILECILVSLTLTVFRCIRRPRE